mgnify:CR=1 FL=1
MAVSPLLPLLSGWLVGAGEASPVGVEVIVVVAVTVGVTVAVAVGVTVSCWVHLSSRVMEAVMAALPYPTCVL